MKINKAGLDLIKRFEGCRLTAYLCPAGIPTIGVGHVVDVKLGMTITQHQADVVLESDLDLFEGRVTELLRGTPVSSNAYSALVSFAFNVGVAALAKSTLLKKLRANGPLVAAPEFLKWNKAGGKVLAGLVKRREAERLLFLTP